MTTLHTEEGTALSPSARERPRISIAIIVTVACGMTVGLINGLIVTVIGVNALVTTLGIGTMVVGVSYAISGGSPIVLSNPQEMLKISFTNYFGIPLPIYLMAVVA